MAARHIPLALEASVLVETATCESGARKTSPLVGLAQKLRRLGVDLRYIDMNGPLIAGHVDTRPPHCHAPMAKVAADAATMARALKAIYPDLQFGDVEPVGTGANFVDADELREWFGAFEAAAGFPIHHIHLDVSWGTPWRDNLLKIAAAAQASGVALGVIYDSDNTQLSDAQWAEATTRNYLAVENLLGGKLDEVVFQSWGRYPRRALPETSPTSLTGVVRDYLREPVAIDVAVNGAVRLLDRNLRPIAGARIIEEQADSDPQGRAQQVNFAGVAPADTTKARLGLRFNTECACESGPTHVTLGGFSFSQQGAPTFRWAIGDWPARWSEVARASASGAIVFSAPTGEKIVINGPEFPIVPNAPFELDFALKGGSDGRQTGVLVVIFEDVVRERHRTFYPLGTTWRQVAEATTDGRGVAHFPILPQPPGFAREIRYSFAGDSLRRPVVAPGRPR